MPPVGVKPVLAGGACSHPLTKVEESVPFKWCTDCGAVAARWIDRGVWRGWWPWHTCKLCLLPGPYAEAEVKPAEVKP